MLVGTTLGAVTSSQLKQLSGYQEAMTKLLRRAPHCVNIRHNDSSGDTLLHLYAREGCSDALRYVLDKHGKATYTPVQNADGDTALQVAIKKQYRDVAKLLWSRLTPHLNEKTALHMTRTLALLASKRTTSMLVQPFLNATEETLTRELFTFRTTFSEATVRVWSSPHKQAHGL